MAAGSSIDLIQDLCPPDTGDVGRSREVAADVRRRSFPGLDDPDGR
jgi:hypothetical protein